MTLSESLLIVSNSIRFDVPFGQQMVARMSWKGPCQSPRLCYRQQLSNHFPLYHNLEFWSIFLGKEHLNLGYYVKIIFRNGESNKQATLRKVNTKVGFDIFGNSVTHTWLFVDCFLGMWGVSVAKLWLSDLNGHVCCNLTSCSAETVNVLSWAWGGGGGGGWAEFRGIWFLTVYHMLLKCLLFVCRAPFVRCNMWSFTIWWFCLPFLSIWAPLMMTAPPADKKNNNTVFLLLNAAFGKEKVR